VKRLVGVPPLILEFGAKTTLQAVRNQPLALLTLWKPSKPDCVVLRTTMPRMELVTRGSDPRAALTTAQLFSGDFLRKAWSWPIDVFPQSDPTAARSHSVSSTLRDEKYIKKERRSVTTHARHGLP